MKTRILLALIIALPLCALAAPTLALAQDHDPAWPWPAGYYRGYTVCVAPAPVHLATDTTRPWSGFWSQQLAFTGLSTRDLSGRLWWLVATDTGSLGWVASDLNVRCARTYVVP